MYNAAFRPEESDLNNHEMCYKIREMMMLDAQGGDKLLGQKGQRLNRVDGIDTLIQEEFLERRRSHHLTVPEST